MRISGLMATAFAVVLLLAGSVTAKEPAKETAKKASKKPNTKQVIVTPVGDTISSPMKALFISIENYQLKPLAYASNDIGRFSTLLQTRYNCDSSAMIDGPSDAAPGNAPDYYQKAVQKKIAEWCAALKADETAILYLAGHGVPDSKGKLFLPMVNFDRHNFKTAAIPMSWIREKFGAAKAKCKLILLDTCFSGIGKGLDDFTPCDAVTMARSFDGMERVTTMASSRENQQSWIWLEMKHSLFTYWLIEAFKGNADTNNDHFLTIDELTDYLDKNVSWISESNTSMQPQTPTVLHAEKIQNLFRLPIPAAQLNEVVDNIASQLDLAMRLHDCGNLMIPKFVTGPDGNAINPSYGTLPKNVADTLRRALALKQNRKDSYVIFNENVTHELLNRLGIHPRNLGGQKTESLKIGGKQVEAIAVGRIDMYYPTALAVTVELTNAKTMESLGCYRGVARLDEARLGQAGASFVRHEAMKPRPIAAGPSNRQSYRLIAGMDQLVQAPVVDEMRAVNKERNETHPMLNPALPFEAHIMTRPAGSTSQTGYTERKGALIRNDYYIPLNAGEEYVLYLKNKNSFDIIAKVLVDGCNTISQTMTVVSKGMLVEAVDELQNGEMVFMPRVSLDDALGWQIPGTTNPKNAQSFSIDGFRESLTGVVHPFVVSDSPKEIKAREDYKDQLGLITVAFYRAVPAGARGTFDVITVLGPGVPQNVETFTGVNPGELLAVYNIRYVSQKLFDSMLKGLKK